MLQVLEEVDPDEHERFVEHVLDSLAKKNLTSSSSIGRNVLEDVIKESNIGNKEMNNQTSDNLFVIDSFDIPKSIFCEQKKKLIKINETTRSYKDLAATSVIGDAASKIELFYQRFQIIKQRTIRHELFSPCVVTNNSNTKKKFQLKPIEFLLSNSNNLQEIIVLGMLSQLKENKFFLEDPTGCLPLNLTDTKYHSGVYTEGSFVLAEGNLVDGLFEVKALGFPPAEQESVTRAYFGNINFFGGPSDISCKSISLNSTQDSTLHLNDTTQAPADSMIVFLSDIWLDSPKILNKLQTLFIGYSEFPPHAFVICGNFLSNPKYGLRCNDLTGF
jgi:DNA polymerase epsilon subunit 2